MSHDPRRAFLADLFRKAGEKASDAVLQRLERVGINLSSEEEAEAEAAEGPRYTYHRPYFRPPGAVPEAEFLELCGRCRKCVDVCPELCITPAQKHMGAPLGTPILFPNDAACTLCGDCMDVCPSGALMPTPPNFVRIGVAAILEETCVAWGEEHCTACHDACPVTPNAIVFPADAHGQSPDVDVDACTGCGLCIKPCPTAPKSVEVRLRPLEYDLEDDAGDDLLADADYEANDKG